MIKEWIAALLLLTGCGGKNNSTAAGESAANSASSADSASDGASSASDAAAETWVFGTANFNCSTDGENARSLIELMQRGKEVEYTDVKVYARNFALGSLAGDSPEYRMLLTEEYGWVISDSTHFWQQSEELFDQLNHGYFTAMKPNAGMLAEAYDGGSFTMSAGDIAEGMMWLDVNITGNDTVAGVKEYSLKNSAGKSIDVILIANDSPSAVPEAKLHALADASQMPAGKYTLTVGDVSTEFSVIDPAEYIKAHK